MRGKLSDARPSPSDTALAPAPPAPRDRALAAAGTARDRQAEGDRRLVTVLFADLAGFTALAESLDPEEVRALQTDLFRELSGAIERYDGFVEKFVGDAVMAVFGAPHAHEDDPERALHAALLMHERVAALSERWERRVHRPLALHVGVNTGPVVAGTIGSASGSAYAVTGDTVNTASRLQAAASAAETFVSPSTHQLTDHAFLLAPAGEITMKGKSQPLAVFRLEGARAIRRSGRGLQALGLSAPMVGRTAELGQMVSAFDEMLRSRAQVVSLTGEAGVGKSRLLQEWLASLEAGRRLTSVSVRHAVCSSLGEQPYAVFAAFFREAYGVASGDSLAVARQKLAAGLAALGGEEEETATIASLLGYVLGVEAADRFRHVEPEQLKRQIFLAMRRLIERRLQHGPVVLTVENLHWADAASMELLQVVLDRLADQPLMLVATCRPGAELRTLATPRAARTEIRLMALSSVESETLLAAYLGESIAGMPPRLRQLVLARASGQPFYLEEILRGLIAAGVLVRGETGWTCTTGAAAADVPPTIHGLLLAGWTAFRTGRGTRFKKPRSSGRCSTRPSSARSPAILTPSRRRWSSFARPTSWRTRRGWRMTAWRACRVRRETAGTGSPTRSFRRSRTRASCSATGPSCTLAPARCWKAWSGSVRSGSRTSRPSRVTGTWAVTGARRRDSS